nr:phospholipase D family protein [uncultured Kingella sp.]
MRPTLLLLPLLTACQALPDLSQREPSIYIPTVHSPQLEHALNLPPNSDPNPAPPAQETQTKPQTEPVFNAHTHIIDQASQAYALRASLIDNANVSIDAQYYIWHNDTTGKQLLQKLHQAAERGVRVRLLLDDNNTNGMDSILTALNAHPNIQIRLFNPFLIRKWRALGYLTDFPRVNRRMHNKTLTADNRASIIGGRNIGDEYLTDSAQKTTFADMDVLVSGSIVTRISQEFDRYWRSDSAYPLETIIKPTARRIAQGNVQLNALTSNPAPESSPQGSLKYYPSQIQLVSDDPAKALDRKVRVNVWNEIQKALGTPQRELYLVSPYFVPTRTGADIMQTITQSGIHTTILTNSLAATDVAPVHSGYMRYRKPLLRAGVELYELKAESNDKKRKLKDRGLTGNSSTSLHAKTFIVDKQRVFVGSFNLDPRSARLNTEMGVVIQSPELAQTLQQQLHQQAQHEAYHVTLDANGKTQWHDPDHPKQPPYTTEPQASLFKRALSKLLSWLPIERLL